MPNLYWVAYLSDGRTITENDINFGRLSPWKELITWLSRNQLISIKYIEYRDGDFVIRTNKGGDGYMVANETFMSVKGKTGFKRGIGTVIQDKVFINWIDENGIVTQDIRDLNSSIVHCWIKNGT